MKQFFKVGDKVRLKIVQELVESGWTPISSGYRHVNSNYGFHNRMFELPSYKWYTINAACQGKHQQDYIFDEQEVICSLQKCLLVKVNI